MRFPHPGQMSLRGKTPDLADCQSVLTIVAGICFRSRASVADRPSHDGHRQKMPVVSQTDFSGMLHMGQMNI